MSSSPVVLGARGPRIIKGSDVVEQAGWVAPTVNVDGEAQSATMSPPGYSLWLARGTLAAGTALDWQLPHGDEVLYVLDGELDVDGRRCPTGGAVVVESGVLARCVAQRETRLLHFGPVDPVPPVTFAGPPHSDGHSVHVIGPAGTYAMIEGTRDTRFYMDSSCETCRLTLLYTGRAEAYESNAHSHSTDEIIYMLTGGITFGAYAVDAGDALCIAKDVRYKFSSPGFLMLNYRADGSYQTIERDKPPIREGGAVHGFTPVMDLR